MYGIWFNKGGAGGPGRSGALPEGTVLDAVDDTAVVPSLFAYGTIRTVPHRTIRTIQYMPNKFSFFQFWRPKLIRTVEPFVKNIQCLEILLFFIAFYVVTSKWLKLPEKSAVGFYLPEKGKADADLSKTSVSKRGIFSSSRTVRILFSLPQCTCYTVRMARTVSTIRTVQYNTVHCVWCVRMVHSTGTVQYMLQFNGYVFVQYFTIHSAGGWGSQLSVDLEVLGVMVADWLPWTA